MISPRCSASAQRSRKSCARRAKRPHRFGRIVGVPDDAKLLAVRVELMDEMRDDLDLAAVEVEFARLAVGRLDDHPALASTGSAASFGNRSRWSRSSRPASLICSSVMRTGSPSKVGIGKHARGRAGVIDDVEPELAVVVAQARAAADDLLELAHGPDDAGQHDVLAGRRINTGRQQLRGREDDGRLVSTS